MSCPIQPYIKEGLFDKHPELQRKLTDLDTEIWKKLRDKDNIKHFRMYGESLQMSSPGTKKNKEQIRIFKEINDFYGTKVVSSERASPRHPTAKKVKVNTLPLAQKYYDELYNKEVIPVEEVKDFKKDLAYYNYDEAHMEQESKEITNYDGAKLKALEDHSIQVKRVIQENLPKDIAESIEVLDSVPLSILGRKDLFLSMKDVFEEKGITNSFLINWLGINLSSNLTRGNIIKSINSEAQIEKMANDSYNKLLKSEDPILKNKDIKESFDKWIKALENYPVVFRDLMLKHAIKHLRNPERRSKFVLQLSTVALQQTYGIAVNKPHELNRIGKLYDSEVLKTVSDAVGHEPSASGNGYWVHIPRTEKGLTKEDEERLTETLEKFRNPSNVTKTFGYNNTRYYVENGEIKRFFVGLTLSAFEINNLISEIENKLKNTTPQYKVNVELLRKLSPSTWCTASGMASHYVENYDNYLLIVNGITVAGIEAGNIGNNGKRQVKEVTSRGNNGVASIDHLDDIVAFFEKHNLDLENRTIKNALEYKKNNKTDNDVFKDRSDNLEDFEQTEEEYWAERNAIDRYNGEFEDDPYDNYDPYGYYQAQAENLNTIENVWNFLGQQGVGATEFFPDLQLQFRNNYEIAKFSVEDRPTTIRGVEHNAPFYLELAKIAVDKNPQVYEYLSENAKQDLELKKKYDYFLKNIQDRAVNLEATAIERSANYNQAEIERIRTRNPTFTLTQILNEIDVIDDLPFSKTNTNLIQGYYDAKSDKVVIIASNTPVEEAAKVGIHEVAHRGMVRMAKELGGEKELFQVLKNAEKQLMEKLPELLKRTGHKSLESLMLDYGFDKNSEEGKFKLLQELSARWAETLVDKPKPSWWKQLVRNISKWIERFTGKVLSEEEVDSLVGGFVTYGTKINSDTKNISITENKEEDSPYIPEITALDNPKINDKGQYLLFNLDENQVNFQLKIVEALQKLSTPQEDKRTRKYGEVNASERLTIRLNTKERPNLEFNLRKTLQNKGVTNQQIDFVFDYMKSNNIQEISTEELALELASKYSYAVEINTAKEKGKIEQTYSGLEELDVPNENWISTEGINYTVEENENYNYFTDTGGTPLNYFKDGEKISLSKFRREYIKDFNSTRESNEPTNTSYYSNLTVPGGTNYTENAIQTPNILNINPAHTEDFSKGVSNMLGWFRSDVQATGGENMEYDLPESMGGREVKWLQGDYKITKIRRILEVQSALFQQGRDREDLISTNDIYEQLVNRNIDIENDPRLINRTHYENLLDDLMRSGVELSEANKIVEEEKQRVQKFNLETIKKDNKFSQNQFLQLLNKDNNWVTFFVKAIVQSTAKETIQEVDKNDVEAKVRELEKSGVLKINCT